jgi:uncharacterized RDD family membrane protein YckC
MIATSVLQMTLQNQGREGLIIILVFVLVSLPIIIRYLIHPEPLPIVSRPVLFCILPLFLILIIILLFLYFQQRKRGQQQDRAEQ